MLRSCDLHCLIQSQRFHSHSPAAFFTIHVLATFLSGAKPNSAVAKIVLSLLQFKHSRALQQSCIKETATINKPIFMDIATEQIVTARFRLECKNATILAHQFPHHDGVPTDIGAYVNNKVARLNNRLDKARFCLLPDPIVGNRPADYVVSNIEVKDSISRLRHCCTNVRPVKQLRTQLKNSRPFIFSLCS